MSHLPFFFSFFILRFSDIFQNGTTLLRNYLHCLLVGQMTGPQKFGKLFVGCWPLLVLLQTMLVPAVLEADWDLLQDHSQVVKKHWEEPVAVRLQKQPMSVADLEHTVNELKYSIQQNLHSSFKVNPQLSYVNDPK